MTPTTRLLNPADLRSKIQCRTPRQRQRRRWTAEQKAELLARFASSGLTATEFCRRAGLSAGMFSAWGRRQRAASAVSAVPVFAEVQLADRGPGSTAATTLVVHFGADIRLPVPPGTDATWLGQLLRAARAS